jgi:dienelactone hydrolase
MQNRCEFMQWTAGALGAPLAGAAVARDAPSGQAAEWCALDSSRATNIGDTVGSPGLDPTNSDIGSLFPFVDSQARKRDFPLSYLNGDFKDLAEWRNRARGKLLELLHYDPPPCAPNAEVVERTERDGLVQEKVYFNTTPDIRVPAYVLMPAAAKRPLPAIVALHDHGGFYLWGKEKLVAIKPEHAVLTEFRKRYYAETAIADTLARQGYIVIVIDMFYWGERRMLLDDDPVDWRERPVTMPAERVAAFNQRASQSEQLVGRSIFAAGFTWPGVMFWDDIRTIDYLVSRPEVDSSRVGCVGLSVGGLRACHLAALDERVKAAVVVGWMASFPRQLQRHVRNTIGHTKIVPGLYRYMDYPDVAALSMPRALLVIQGSRDGLFESQGVQVCFEKLDACYAKAGVPDRFRGRLYDAPHEFNEEMQHEAWDWLKRWL